MDSYHFFQGRFSIRSMSILQRSNMDRTNLKQESFLSDPPEEKQFDFFGDHFFANWLQQR